MFEDAPEGFPAQVSSVVQNRGSIPLFWSQETSRLNIKPDIICMSFALISVLLLVLRLCLVFSHGVMFISYSIKEGPEL